MPTARTAAGVGGAAAAVALPLLLSGPYHRHVLVLAGLFVLMALGFDLVLGYLGELSLGHAAFFGIGAYTTALLTRNFGVPFPIDLLLAAVVTGFFGFLIGAPSLRLKGPYFAIVTFGFAEILRLIVLNWTSVTRGPMGLPDIPHLRLGPFRIHTELGYYYVVLVLIGVAILVTRRLLTSTVGHAFAGNPVRGEAGERAPAEPDPTSARGQEARDQAEAGRLPGAVGPDQAGDRPLLDREADLVDGGEAAEPHSESLHLKQGHGPPGPDAGVARVPAAPLA